jgi:hypothetical protein
MDFLAAERMIAQRDRRLFRYAETAGEIWKAVAPSLATT